MSLDPVTGAVIGGALSSAIGGLFGRSSAGRSIRFQREMAQKGHQYEVEDLRLAGLNPILSGTGGPGAKASGGAMAPPLGDIASSALGIRRLTQEIENLKATKDKTDAETDYTKSKTGVITPISDLGRGLGAITTPLADSIRQISISIPATAKKVKGALEKAEDAIKDYLFEKSHKNKSFHGRKEILR